MISQTWLRLRCFATTSLPTGHRRDRGRRRQSVLGFGPPRLEALEERCLLASLAPTVTTLAATNVTTSTVTLNGSVNPNGKSTDTLFQYSIDPTLPANVVMTLAGTAGKFGSADGTGSAARFFDPADVAVDAAGNVYVADSGNDTIREITPAGVVTTLAGAPGQPGSADGTGSAARFNDPVGVAVDAAGNVYVADTANDTIREITPAGVVTTLAGAPGHTGSANGIGSAARFAFPASVAVDGAGNVYVADTDNETIREITPAGAVSTLAGVPRQAGSADGTGSAARFNFPEGVAVDGVGNVYVADDGNQTIRTLFIPSVPAQSGLTGTGSLAVNAALAGLTPGRTYFFRAVAINVGGVTLGPIQGFTTTSVSPLVTNLQRFGFHTQPTLFVLTFDAALDPNRAQDVHNYRLVQLTAGRPASRIRFSAAVYNPAANTVTLVPVNRVFLYGQYRLTVNGTAPAGLTSTAGQFLSGQGTGHPGTNFVQTFGQEILAGPNVAETLSRVARSQIMMRRAHYAGPGEVTRAVPASHRRSVALTSAHRGPTHASGGPVPHAAAVDAALGGVAVSR